MESQLATHTHTRLEEQLAALTFLSIQPGQCLLYLNRQKIF